MPKKHAVVLALLVLMASALVYGKKTTRVENKPSEPQQRSAMPADEYESFVAEMRNLQKSNSDLVSLKKYGKSDDGRDCVYLKMGTADKPKILIEGGLGAGERQTVAATVKLLRAMIRNRDDKEVRWLLANREVYFVPVASPDAFVSGVQQKCAFPDGTRLNATTASIKSLVDFANEMKFKAVLSLHSEGINIAEPIGVRSKDRAAISKVMEKMSAVSGMAIGDKSTRDDANWFYNTGSCSVVVNVGDGTSRAYEAAVAFMRESAEHEMNPLPIKPIFYQAD